MRRVIVTPLLVIFSTLGIVIATAIPAGAITTNTEIVETFGAFGLTPNGVVDGNAITQGSTPSHDFAIVDQGGFGYGDPSGLCQAIVGGNCPIVQLYAGKDVNTGKDECAAATTSDALMKLKPCSGSNGVNWAKLCFDFPTCSRWVFINDWQSTLQGNDIVISGDDVLGDNTTCQDYGNQGQLQKWTLVAS